MHRIQQIFAYLMTAMFLWAAFVQLNDPDAGLWIGIYGLAAAASLLFALGRLPSWIALLLGVAYLTGAFFFWPEAYEGVRFGERGMANMNIELGRESLGLGITALVLFFYSWRARGRRIS